MENDNKNKLDQTISIANHQNVRENYRGYAVPVYPITRNRIFDSCFGMPSKQKIETPRLSLSRGYSKTLYKNIDVRS